MGVEDYVISVPIYMDPEQEFQALKKAHSAAFLQAQPYSNQYGGQWKPMDKVAGEPQGMQLKYADPLAHAPKPLKPAKMKKIKKLTGWKEVEPEEPSTINDSPTGQAVTTEGFEKVVGQLLVGYKYLYDQGLTTSMIAVLCAHYGGTSVAEATAVFNGLKELKSKLEYKNPEIEFPEIE